MDSQTYLGDMAELHAACRAALAELDQAAAALRVYRGTLDWIQARDVISAFPAPLTPPLHERLAEHGRKNPEHKRRIAELCKCGGLTSATFLDLLEASIADPSLVPICRMLSKPAQLVRALGTPSRWLLETGTRLDVAKGLSAESGSNFAAAAESPAVFAKGFDDLMFLLSGPTHAKHASEELGCLLQLSTDLANNVNMTLINGLTHIQLVETTRSQFQRSLYADVIREVPSTCAINLFDYFDIGRSGDHRHVLTDITSADEPDPGPDSPEYLDTLTFKEKISRACDSYIMENEFGQLHLAWTKQLLASLQRALHQTTATHDNLRAYVALRDDMHGPHDMRLGYYTVWEKAFAPVVATVLPPSQPAAVDGLCTWLAKCGGIFATIQQVHVANRECITKFVAYIQSTRHDTSEGVANTVVHLPDIPEEWDMLSTSHLGTQWHMNDPLTPTVWYSTKEHPSRVEGPATRYEATMHLRNHWSE